MRINFWKILSIVVVLLCVLSTSVWAKVWTYESNNALNVMWDADADAEFYRINMTDLETNESRTQNSFDTSIKLEGLINHRIYRIVVTTNEGSAVGTTYVCYNIDSVAITIDQGQLNEAISQAMPDINTPTNSGARVLVGDDTYIGYVELTNTTDSVKNVTVNVGKYSVPVTIQPYSAWADLAENICPDKGSWAAWIDNAPEGILFNAGWYEF